MNVDEETKNDLEVPTPVIGEMSAKLHAVSSVNNEQPSLEKMKEEQSDFVSDIETDTGHTTVGHSDVPLPEGPRNELEAFLAEKAGLLADMDASIFSLTKKEKFNRNDIMKALTRQNKVIKALDTLADAVIHDLQIANSRYNVLETNMFKITQQLTVITSVLKDKNLVTEEEIVETWEKKIKPQMEQKVAELQKKMSEPAPATTATEEVAPV
jgi:hypothetical protein